MVGAGEIGVPAFVSTLCICIVFVPMFFLSGVARFLFVPLAEAVVFAMVASYLLSRTLVPTLVMLLMGGVHAEADGETRPAAAALPQLRSAVRARPPRLHARAVGGSGSTQGVRLAVPRLLPVVLPAVPGARARFLPQRRRGPDPPAHARADRHAHRGNRAARRRGRGGDPRDRSRRPARNHPGQPGRAQQRHQPVVQQRRNDRHARRRDPDVAARGAPSHRGVRHPAARRAAQALSRHRVLLSAGGHRHADPELRPARRDRRPVLRAPISTRMRRWRAS